LSRIAEKIPESKIAQPAALGKIIGFCQEEADISFSYDYHHLAKAYRVSPGPIASVLNAIQEEGYQATRVHYSGYCIKTDAPLEVIRTHITAQ